MQRLPRVLLFGVETSPPKSSGRGESGNFGFGMKGGGEGGAGSSPRKESSPHAQQQQQKHNPHYLFCASTFAKARTHVVTLITVTIWVFLVFFLEPRLYALDHHMSGDDVSIIQMGTKQKEAARLATLRRHAALGRGRRAGAAAGLVGCVEIDASYVEERLKGAVLRRMVPALQTHYGGAPFTPSSILAVHPCTRGAWELGVPDAWRDFVFVVMGGSIHLARARAIRSTWGTLVPYEKVVIFGDVNHTETGMMTLGMLAGKKSYYDAQHRTLQGLIHTMRSGLAGEALWVFLVDDDTYVNVHELPGFLVGWDSRVPLIFAHIWYGPEARGNDEGSWPSGGAGIVLSRRAADLLSVALYSKVCPFFQLNDVTIGHCATRLGIPMIHSPMFDPEGNVMVPETRTVQRMVRLDGTFARPTSCFREFWTYATPEGSQPLVAGEEERSDEPVGPDGERLTQAQLDVIWGKPEQWTQGEEIVVVRRPLKDVYKTRTSIEGPIFLHR